MDDVLKQMVKIYVPDGIDWMGYQLTRKNPYTFHHIKEVRNGGKRNVSNGAILTSNAHQDLNFLDCQYNIIYLDLNYCFKELNKTELPPTDDYYEEVGKILIKVPSWYRRRKL